MATTNYTLRVDETDKKNAEQVFKNLGMSFATGINIYIKTVSRQKRIPFNMDLNEVRTDGSTSKTLRETLEALQKESVLNGIDGMTMEEIDREIQMFRNGKHGK